MIKKEVTCNFFVIKLFIEFGLTILETEIKKKRLGKRVNEEKIFKEQDNDDQ